MFWTLFALNTILEDLYAAAAAPIDGILEDVRLAIFVNDLAVDQNTTWADLVEATWTGYARSAQIAWGSPIISNITGLPIIVGPCETFLCTDDGGTPQTAYGAALIIAGAPDVLVAVGRFDEPQLMETDHAFVAIPRVGIGAELEIPLPLIALT